MPASTDARTKRGETITRVLYQLHPGAGVPATCDPRDVAHRGGAGPGNGAGRPLSMAIGDPEPFLAIAEWWLGRGVDAVKI